MILKCESCKESWIFPTFIDWLLFIPGPLPLNIEKQIDTRVVYCASFFDKIWYNTIWYIGHRTLSLLNTLKICSLSVRGHFWILNFEPDDQKCYFSNPTLYWRIIKTMYRISPDRCKPVCIAPWIYWFTP